MSVVLNLYHRVAETLLKDQRTSGQGRRGPSLEVIIREIETLGARMHQTVKNYMTEHMSQLADEVGANTATITSTQALIEDGNKALTDNFATRLTALEEVVVSYEGKVFLIPIFTSFLTLFLV